MAKADLLTISSPIFLLLLLITITTTAAAELNSEDGYSRLLSPAKLRLRKEKLSHLRFFLHDTLTGANPTAVPIARPSTTNVSSSPTNFGTVIMVDDPLTVGPESTSKLVGRAQGIYGLASQSKLVLTMALNLAFSEGQFNGSTLNIYGRNVVALPVREMPVTGGTGAFRFARGYAKIRTQSLDLKTGDGVLEYNVYVFH